MFDRTILDKEMEKSRREKLLHDKKYAEYERILESEVKTTDEKMKNILKTRNGLLIIIRKLFEKDEKIILICRHKLTFVNGVNTCFSLKSDLDFEILKDELSKVVNVQQIDDYKSYSVTLKD